MSKCALESAGPDPFVSGDYFVKTPPKVGDPAYSSCRNFTKINLHQHYLMDFDGEIQVLFPSITLRKDHKY